MYAIYIPALGTGPAPELHVETRTLAHRMLPCWPAAVHYVNRIRVCLGPSTATSLMLELW